jgi:glycosyltransferase 2 family protein
VIAPPPPTPRRLGRAGRLVLGLAVSGAFVALAVWSLAGRGVTLESVLDRLSAGHYGFVGVYVLVLLLLAALRVVRWGFLVRGLGDISWRKITSVSLLGQMAIGVLPMRLGEAVRPLLILERGRLGFGQATATVVVERVVDGILLGGLLAATLWALSGVPLPPEFRIGAWVTTAVFGGLAVFLLVGTLFHYRVLKLVRALLGPLWPRLAERLVGLIESFLLALRTLARQRRALALFLATTLVIWLVTGLSLLPIFAAFGVELPLVASFTVVCVMVIGYMIPAGPAATGTLNYAIVVALSAFGVDEAVTGALAILLYVLILGVNVAVGLLGLWLGQRPLREVFTAELPADVLADETATPVARPTGTAGNGPEPQPTRHDAPPV